MSYQEGSVQNEFKKNQKSDLLFPIQDDHPYQEYNTDDPDYYLYKESIKDSEVDFRLGLLQSAISKLGLILQKILTHNSKEQSHHRIYVQVMTLLNNQALKYLNSGDLQNAMLILEKCDIWTNNPSLDPLMRALTLNNIGSCFRKRGKLSNSLDLFSESLRIMLENNIKSYLSSVYLNLAIVQSQIGAHLKALEFARKALSEAQYNLMDIQKINSVNFKDSNLDNSQIDQTNQFRKQSGNFGYGETKQESNIINLVLCYRTLAQEEEHFQNYDEALHNYENAVDIAQENLGSQNNITLTCIREFSKFSALYSKKFIQFNSPTKKQNFLPSPYRVKKFMKQSGVYQNKIVQNLNQQFSQKRIVQTPFQTTLQNSFMNANNIGQPLSKSQKEIPFQSQQSDQQQYIKTSPNVQTNNYFLDSFRNPNNSSLKSSMIRINQNNSSLSTKNVSQQKFMKRMVFTQRPTSNHGYSKSICFTSTNYDSQSQEPSEQIYQISQQSQIQTDMDNNTSTQQQLSIISKKQSKASLGNLDQFKDYQRGISTGSSRSIKDIRPLSSTYKNNQGIKIFMTKTQNNSPSKNQNTFKVTNSPYFSQSNKIETNKHEEDPSQIKQLKNGNQIKFLKRPLSSMQLVQKQQPSTNSYQLDNLKNEYEQTFSKMKKIENQIKKQLLLNDNNSEILTNNSNSNINTNTNSNSFFKSPNSTFRSRNLRPASVYLTQNVSPQKNDFVIEKQTIKSQDSQLQNNFLNQSNNVSPIQNIDIPNSPSMHSVISLTNNASQEPLLIHEIQNANLEDSNNLGLFYQVKMTICIIFSSIDLVFQLQHVINVSDIYAQQQFSQQELQNILIKICSEFSSQIIVDTLNNCLTYQSKDQDSNNDVSLTIQDVDKNNKIQQNKILLRYKEYNIQILLKNPSCSIVYSSKLSAQEQNNNIFNNKNQISQSKLSNRNESQNISIKISQPKSISVQSSPYKNKNNQQKQQDINIKDQKTQVQQQKQKDIENNIQNDDFEKNVFVPAEEKFTEEMKVKKTVQKTEINQSNSSNKQLQDTNNKMREEQKEESLSQIQKNQDLHPSSPKTNNTNQNNHKNIVNENNSIKSPYNMSTNPKTQHVRKQSNSLQIQSPKSQIQQQEKETVKQSTDQKQPDVKNIYTKVQEVKKVEVITTPQMKNSSNVKLEDTQNSVFQDKIVQNQSSSFTQSNQQSTTNQIKTLYNPQNYLASPQKKQNQQSPKNKQNEIQNPVQLKQEPKSVQQSNTQEKNQQNQGNNNFNKTEGNQSINQKRNNSKDSSQLLSHEEQKAGLLIWRTYKKNKFRKAINEVIRRNKAGRLLVSLIKRQKFKKTINELIKQKKAAKFIIKCYRRKKFIEAIKQGLALRKAVKQIQRNYRRRKFIKCVTDAIKRKKAARIIIKAIQRRKFLKVLKAARIANFNQKYQKAAITIQKCIRRIKFKKAILETLKRRKAAKTIWRAYQRKKFLMIIKKAKISSEFDKKDIERIIKIQRKFRQHKFIKAVKNAIKMKKAVVRIQKAYKRRKFIKLVSQAVKQKRAARIILKAYQRRKFLQIIKKGLQQQFKQKHLKAVLMIQRNYRRKKFIKTINLAVKLKSAVKKIQSAYRKKKFIKAIEYCIKRRKAAKIIWKAYQRKRFLKVISTASIISKFSTQDVKRIIQIQRAFRRKVFIRKVMERVKMKRVAIKIQRAYRRRQFRKLIIHAIKARRAAKIIVKAMKRRRFLKLTKQVSQLAKAFAEKEWKAAIYIQKRYRAKKFLNAINQMIQKRRAARLILKAYRKRKFLKVIKQAQITSQFSQQDIKYIIKIQRAYRLRKFRKNVMQAVKQRKAARIILRAVKLRRFRKAIKQAHIESKFSQQDIKHIIKIQRAYRLRKFRRTVIQAVKQRKAARIILKAIKLRRFRKAINQARIQSQFSQKDVSYIIKIQRAYRIKKFRKLINQALKERRAAKVILRAYKRRKFLKTIQKAKQRAYLEKRISSLPSKGLTYEEKKAGFLIFRNLRRKQLIKAIKQFVEIKKYIIRIQKAFRRRRFIKAVKQIKQKLYLEKRIAALPSKGLTYEQKKAGFLIFRNLRRKQFIKAITQFIQIKKYIIKIQRAFRKSKFIDVVVQTKNSNTFFSTSFKLKIFILFILKDGTFSMENRKINKDFQYRNKSNNLELNQDKLHLLIRIISKTIINNSYHKVIDNTQMFNSNNKINNNLISKEDHCNNNFKQPNKQINNTQKYNLINKINNRKINNNINNINHNNHNKMKVINKSNHRMLIINQTTKLNKTINILISLK